MGRMLAAEGAVHMENMAGLDMAVARTAETQSQMLNAYEKASIQHWGLAVSALELHWDMGTVVESTAVDIAVEPANRNRAT